MLDLPGFEDAGAVPWPTVVRRLSLTQFRNYSGLTLSFDGRPVVLTGANGAGKTNLLEAVSLLAPGRGLRRAGHDDLATENGPGTWALFAAVESGGETVEIGTGLDPSTVAGEGGARLVRINRQPQKSSNALAPYVTVLWLTPDQDGLFRGPAGDRRRFLDRFALALDPEHGTRVSALERLHRNRNRILDETPSQGAWLDAVERELAETAVAVAATRLSTVERLAATIAAHLDPSSPFPHAILTLEGDVEAWLTQDTAPAVEDRYRAALRELRPRDAAAGRGTLGPHLSDLRVVHGPKNVAADRASTGEQKALLVGLVLAQARLVSETSGRRPILLLDEIAAHLDEIRRAGLFAELDRLGCQSFMTGTDPMMFKALSGRAQFFEVTNGHVAQVER